MDRPDRSTEDQHLTGVFEHHSIMPKKFLKLQKNLKEILVLIQQESINSYSPKNFSTQFSPSKNTSFSRVFCSSSESLESTQSLTEKSGFRPIPILSRANWSVHSSWIVLSNPFCPPWLPDARNRTFPNGRSISSEITNKSFETSIP